MLVLLYTESRLEVLADLKSMWRKGQIASSGMRKIWEVPRRGKIQKKLVPIKIRQPLLGKKLPEVVWERKAPEA